MNETQTAKSKLYAIVERHDLPRLGWEHYSTSIGDNGNSCFKFDLVDSCAQVWSVSIWSDGIYEVRKADRNEVKTLFRQFL